MPLTIEPSGQACGARVRGVDLTRPLTADTVAQLRAIWLQHQVIALPDQRMSVTDLERFALEIGDYGEDPYLEAMPGHRHVVALRREADETAPVFAEAWHSDWSFLPDPPAGTVLLSAVIPPVGGDTLYADQYAAYAALPAAMQRRLDGLMGVHSARRGYAPTGVYGERDRGSGRSMKILSDESALKTRLHPVVRTHPETGRKALFVSPGYTIGIDGMPRDEAAGLLQELFAHQVRPEFVYTHTWQPDMLVLWDNRCLLHRATGGYDGHRRLLYRITIAQRSAARH
ncbi:MAG TPA: TauD/TfdA family dioxygenase [Burkholderiaceae bacterium]|nr:MAG: TauD/TfdA family dioxygenase [Burkholderiaceae bacterium]HOF31271.1 TauD/TfdA family dioxygenase [Burkholderiaceae bacterium]HPL79799.1 TauD/TfdA family dioxygenase [Burkholderiaceae bacterium]HQD81811.1 TauD/TfdA family dioxygenase [Quisquiliibacterium sp.]